jgi:four helix bundle protein
MGEAEVVPQDARFEEKPFDLQERLIQYALRILSVVESLDEGRIASHVGGQLLRCGTSPAPNHAEAQGAESLNDFIHKMKIVLKELRESWVWLQIVYRKPLVQNPERLKPLIQETDELIAIIFKSIQTAKQNN